MKRSHAFFFLWPDSAVLRLMLCLCCLSWQFLCQVGAEKQANRQGMLLQRLVGWWLQARWQAAMIHQVTCFWEASFQVTASVISGWPRTAPEAELKGRFFQIFHARKCFQWGAVAGMATGCRCRRGPKGWKRDPWWKGSLKWGVAVDSSKFRA